MKTNIMTLHPQQIMTKDNVSLKIETVVYYRTVDPYKLLYKLGTNLGEIRTFIAEMSYNALRTVAG
jgi:regulator of protease activity HflC (stomatin/prohibitin superfamily)